MVSSLQPGSNNITLSSTYFSFNLMLGLFLSFSNSTAECTSACGNWTNISLP